MSDRIDPRRQTREIREALGRYEPEQLLDILTHVFRQYVVDGSAPPPMQLQDELSGLSFAQVIERLQLRLDLPELRLFEIQAGRVMVRIDGRLYPLETAESRPEPLPVQRVVSMQPMAPAAPPAPAAAPPAPAQGPAPAAENRDAAPGVHSVGHASAARPQPAAQPARPSPTAAPAARPTAPAARPAATPSQAPATQAAAPAAPARPEKAQTEKNDSPGGRFGLLEID
ncbi:MAG TPA: hypothetical protein PKI49_11835 [Pseudomonadota bacterium]|nr:hypothetical protein [Pseudomonadota bacterium]